MINSLQAGAEYYPTAEYIKEMKELRKRKICDDDIDGYFSVENVQKIASFVYMKPATDKEERRKIRESKDKVLKFLEFCSLAEACTDETDEIDELLIISCLQEIILGKKKEIFDYAFNGFEGKEGERKGKIHVQAALKNDKHTYAALQVYWVHKVLGRIYANIGQSDLIVRYRELEKICYRILEEILSCSKVEDMLILHHLYYNRVAEQNHRSKQGVHINKL